MISPNLHHSIPNLSSNPQSPRLYDHLEHIYNSDALENKQFSNQNKKLYFKLIEQNQQRKLQKKSLEKLVNQNENQQIDIFWKNRENQLRERQKRKKQIVDEARKVNNSMYAGKVLSKSMVMRNSYELANSDYYQNIAKQQAKRLQQKDYKTKFLSQGQIYNDYKQYQQYLERQASIQTEKKKKLENDQLQMKRLEHLERWRKKHLEQHNKEAFQVWDRERRSRMSQQDALQNYIVFHGARELNERTSKMKNQVFERQHAKKQQYIQQLHNQLEDNQYRTGNDSKNQKQYERRIIQERNLLLTEKDRMIKESKMQQNKQHLETLKGQHRPRILLSEKQKVQFPGLGSPVHIGKTLADDRRKQLQWLEKNLYKDLSH